MSQQEEPRDTQHAWALRQGYAYARVLLDGRLVCVEALFAHQALLAITTPVLHVQDCWVYASLEAALAAATAWDGRDEPPGWIRHPASSRQRPGGNPEREYIFH